MLIIVSLSPFPLHDWYSFGAKIRPCNTYTFSLLLHSSLGTGSQKRKSLPVHVGAGLAADSSLKIEKIYDDDSERSL
jgi:hypothetical protein